MVTCPQVDRTLCYDTTLCHNKGISCWVFICLWGVIRHCVYKVKTEQWYYKLQDLKPGTFRSRYTMIFKYVITSRQAKSATWASSMQSIHQAQCLFLQYDVVSFQYCQFETLYIILAWYHIDVYYVKYEYYEWSIHVVE